MLFLKLSGHVTSADSYGEQEPKHSIVSRENKPFEVIKFENDDVPDDDDDDDYNDSNKKMMMMIMMRMRIV